MEDRLYIKDKVDGQQHCLSGNEHFYLIDVTDRYDKIEDITIDSLVLDLRIARKGIIAWLEDGFKNGLLTQKERDVFYFRHIDWNSLVNCGKHFGVTPERIRQIEAKVLEKLRHGR